VEDISGQHPNALPCRVDSSKAMASPNHCC
jgi:hypothetical protein